MLEGVILDRVEQTAAAVVPVISSITTTYPIIGADAASTQYEFIKNYLGQNATTLTNPGMARTRHPQWLPTTSRFALIGTANPSGWLVAFFDPATGTMNAEDTIRALDCLQEDNSGVVWAISNKAGYYGLWKRTGVAAWTQVLSDTAACFLAKWSNGQLYHKSSTGNWYSITSGAATLSSDPGFVAAGVNSYIWQTAYGSVYPGYSTGMGQGTPLALDDAAAFDANHTNDRFWIWTYPGRTRVMRKSAFMWALQSKYPAANVNNLTCSYHPVANSNYWVCVLCAAFSTATDSRLHIELSLCNFANATEQYLGGWDNVSTAIANNLAANTSQYTMGASLTPAHVPAMFYMSNGVLRCYSLGKFNNDVATFAVCRQDIAARITI